MGVLGEASGKGAGLAEGFEGRQALDGVEEFLAEGFEGSRAREAGAALAHVDRNRADEREERAQEQDHGHREVPDRGEGEDREGRGHGNDELGQILAEPGLELLDPVHHREHHPAGAAAREPGRAEGHDAVEELSPQLLLHAGRGAVGDAGAGLLEDGADQDHRGGGECEKKRRPQAAAAEDEGEKQAEEGEPGDAGREGQEPECDGEGDARTHAARERPETEIEIHATIIRQAGAFGNRARRR